MGITMRRSIQSLVLFLSVGILFGISAPRSDADELKAAENNSEIQRWIDQLGSKRFKDREQATQELSKLGESAIPILKEAAQSPDAEVRRRAQQLVERLTPPAPPVDPPPQKRNSVKSYL